MSIEISLDISPQAQEDLDQIGFFTRRLVLKALSDELRTEEPSLPTTEISASNQRSLSIGNYQVIYAPELADDDHRRVVLRVINADQDAAGPGEPSRPASALSSS